MYAPEINDLLREIEDEYPDESLFTLPSEENLEDSELFFY